MDYLKALILGTVEGFTEFLPVSSTGHLLLLGHFLGFESKGRTFEVLVQLGAILAILIVYAGKIISVARALPTSQEARRFVLNVFVAFLPAMVIGGLFGSKIKEALFNPVVVCTMLIAGGLVLILIDDMPMTPRIHDVMDMPTPTAFKIGLAQCVAMIPGVSRSGATIVSSMLLGCDKRTGAEFSFFLAIPTLISAGAYSMWKERHALSLADMPMFAVGFIVSFLAAWACVRWLLRYVSSHTFVPFAWYRIAFGIIVLATWATGTVVWAD